MDKPTWVFSCGTYRTASTTHYQLARDIVETAGAGVGIGYHTESKLVEHDATREHRYIVCKVFEFLPEGFRGETSHGEILHRQGRIKALATIRDPRDIITSMKRRSEGRKPDGTENDWNYEKTVTENFPVWLGQLVKWIDLGPELTLVSRYENFTTNLYREAQRIARHLDIDLPDDELKRIAKAKTIPGINEAKQKAKDEGKREDPWLPSVPGIVFGTSGQWRTWLTPREVKLVEDANDWFFERFGY